MPVRIRPRAPRTPRLSRSGTPTDPCCRWGLAVAVRELLRCAPRRMVNLGQMPHQSEACAELVMQCMRFVPHDVETAAFHWSFGAERRHDDVTARCDCLGYLTDIGGAVGAGGQEMEHSPVVPKVVAVARKWI